MWLLADIARTGMLLAGISLLIIVLLRGTYRHLGRRRSARNKIEPHLERVPRPGTEHRSLSSATGDALKWQVELQETARTAKGELDSKMRVLQLLIAQARSEADRLERVLSRLESTGEEPTGEEPTGAPCPEEPSSRLPRSMDRQAELFALADQGLSATEIAEQVGTPVGEVELILSLRGTS